MPSITAPRMLPSTLNTGTASAMSKQVSYEVTPSMRSRHWFLFHTDVTAGSSLRNKLVTGSPEEGADRMPVARMRSRIMVISWGGALRGRLA